MRIKRPVYLDIPKIRQSVTAVTSILHRISGAGLFLFLPVLLWLFAGTLNHEQGFETYRAFVSHPLAKLILIGLLWAYLHHLLAGIRFLLLDMHRGLEVKTAQGSARFVALAAPVLAIVIGVCLW